MTSEYTTIPTPVGGFTVLATAQADVPGSGGLAGTGRAAARFDGQTVPGTGPRGPAGDATPGERVVLASGWTTDVADLVPLVHPSLRPTELRRRDDLGEITEAVRAYLDGDLAAPDTIQVRQAGGEFLTAAWRVLRKVPPGAPVSYTEYAALAGRPAAVRAAAQACARNPAALFVPCHRVVRVGGALGGFRWGLPVKRWLLDHETR